MGPNDWKLINKWTRQSQDSPGRVYCRFVNEFGNLESTTWARYLMQRHLDVRIPGTHDVDHINGDYTDDRIENLRVLTIKENLNTGARANPAIVIEKCMQCGESTYQTIAQVKKRNTLNQWGPFCSNRCAKQHRKSTFI